MAGSSPATTTETKRTIMDTNTTLADAPVSTPRERTAPADTPAYLSTHESAAVLRKLRQPKGSDQTTTTERAETAAPAETPESTAQAGESAAETPDQRRGQAPPAQTTDTDREAELPPIEPPRSWTKEDKELFTGLPRATQERLAERERSREGDFLRRQNEAAEKLKGLAAKEQAVEQARQTYEAALPQLLQTLQQQQAGEFADIKSMADVERLAREDWPRYLLWDLQQ